MDPLMQLFTWQFTLLSLAIAGATFALRLIIEYFIKNPKPQQVWEELILPLFPLVLGCVVGAFMTKYPYPDGLVSTGGRVVFGMVAGMFSGLVYRVLKATLNQTIGGNVAAPGTAPPPAENVSQEIIDSVRNSIQQ